MHHFVNEFIIKLDDNEDSMMESDGGKFDFGFESEVNKKTSNKRILLILFRNGH